MGNSRRQRPFEVEDLTVVVTTPSVWAGSQQLHGRFVYLGRFAQWGIAWWRAWRSWG